jgi:hypothetical protein
MQKKGSKKAELVHVDVNVVNEEEDDETQVNNMLVRKYPSMPASRLPNST